MRYATVEGLGPVAETLEALGGNPVAISIYRRLYALEPANPHALRNVLSACRTAGDWPSLEETLERVVADGHFRQNEAAHRDLALQLADALIRRRAFDRAQSIVAQLSQSSPSDIRLLVKLADVQERNGRAAEAEASYRRALGFDPANVAARLALAALLDGAGKTDDAIDVLERASGAEIDARLATLSLKLGRLEDAMTLLERIPEADRPRVSLTLADELAKKGDTVRALRLLKGAVGRVLSDQIAFRLQTRIVELLPADTDRTIVRHELRRLRQMAEDLPNVNGLADYFAVAQSQAARLRIENEVREEITQAWDEGHGEISAGAALIAAQLEHGELAQAASVWAQVAVHPSADTLSIQRIDQAFASAGDYRHAAEARQRLARLNTTDHYRLVAWARAAEQAKRHDEALKAALELAGRAVFNPDLTASAADLFAEIGQLSQAGELFARASNADPSGKRTELHIAYARLLIAQKRNDEAWRVLRTASRNPAAELTSTVLQYLDAIGSTANFEEETAGFYLSEGARRDLRQAIFVRQIERGDLSGALQLASKSPALLDARGCESLRKLGREKNGFAQVSARFEQSLLQGRTELARHLAELYADWAEKDLADMQVAQAITHLNRAHQLLRGSWRVAELLAKLQLEQGAPKLAAKTLRSFLAATTDAVEKEKAQEFLTRILGT
jgi:tetratricopeptide (TPR) repeat protein